MIPKGLFSMDMSIAAMSVNVNQAQTQQSVGMAVLGDVFDQMESSAQMISELSAGVDPTLGTNIDISV